MAITMPKRLVKCRREKFRVKKEDFLNMIRFLTFVDVDVDCIALPSSQELDVMFRDAVDIGCHCSSFS